jgi:hypothetical protein
MLRNNVPTPRKHGWQARALACHAPAISLERTVAGPINPAASPSRRLLARCHPPQLTGGILAGKVLSYGYVRENLRGILQVLRHTRFSELQGQRPLV